MWCNVITITCGYLSRVLKLCFKQALLHTSSNKRRTMKDYCERNVFGFSLMVSTQRNKQYQVTACWIQESCSSPPSKSQQNPRELKKAQESWERLRKAESHSLLRQRPTSRSISVNPAQASVSDLASKITSWLLLGYHIPQWETVLKMDCPVAWILSLIQTQIILIKERV